MESGFSLVDVLISMFWFMLLFAWIWLLVMIVGDLFRDTQLSGWGKAAWVLFLVVFPWLGALVYLIARGASMNERALEAAKRQEAQMRAYVREVATPTSSMADELGKLADLHQRGVLGDAEYEQAKATLLHGAAAIPDAHATTAAQRV